MRRLIAAALGLSLVLPAAAAPATVARAACDPFDHAAGLRPGASADRRTESSASTSARSQVTVEPTVGPVPRRGRRRQRRGSSTANAATSVGGRDASTTRSSGRRTGSRRTRLAAIQASLAGPARPAGRRARRSTAALADTPAILWVAGNVHGGEESGADASLHALYELAARDRLRRRRHPRPTPSSSSCRSRTRTAARSRPRRNLYGFDMNRDWFARTQPETDGKLEVVRQYPPMLFIDAHEFGLSNYFFPPNADPEYHEIPDTAHDWINELYSPAIVDAVRRPRASSTSTARRTTSSRSIFGDTVPDGRLPRRRDDLREGERRPDRRARARAVHLDVGVARRPAPTARDAVLAGWHASCVEAYAAGRSPAMLEANARLRAEARPLPGGPGRHRPRTTSCATTRTGPTSCSCSSGACSGWTSRSTQLTAPLAARRDFHPYGDPARRPTLPVGTYWIPLAQAQKHWIQALLHEESWIPFDVTYDVTAWSNPLLMNLDGGWTGEVVDPAVDARRRRSPRRPGRRRRPPAVGRPVRDPQQHARLRGRRPDALPVRAGLGPAVHATSTAADITAGLAGIDVLVIPDGYANYGVQALGAKGKRPSATGSTPAAGSSPGRAASRSRSRPASRRPSSATRTPTCPGTLVRVAVDDGSPLAAGVGDRDWVMYQDDRTMQPGLGTAVGDVPGAGHARLRDVRPGDRRRHAGRDSAAVVDEAVGGGPRRLASRSTRTSGPGRRARSGCCGTPSSGPDAAGFAPASLAGSKARAAAEKAAARRGRRQLPDLGSAIRIRVAGTDATATAKILQRHGAEVVRHRPRRRRCSSSPTGRTCRTTSTRCSRSSSATSSRPASTIRAASLP